MLHPAALYSALRGRSLLGTAVSMVPANVQGPQASPRHCGRGLYSRAGVGTRPGSLQPPRRGPGPALGAASTPLCRFASSAPLSCLAAGIPRHAGATDGSSHKALCVPCVPPARNQWLQVRTGQDGGLALTRRVEEQASRWTGHCVCPSPSAFLHPPPPQLSASLPSFGCSPDGQPLPPCASDIGSASFPQHPLLPDLSPAWRPTHPPVPG